MKLELKHIAPYLPYGLKLKGLLSGDIWEMTALQDGGLMAKDSKYWMDLFDFKPILRNLSDLTKEIEHNGEKFVPAHLLISKDIKDSLQLSFKDGALNEVWHPVHLNVEFTRSDWEKLYEWHFDIFGLIPAGLAIDINTLKP